LCDRYFEFLGVLGTKAAADAQPEGVTRRISFDPSLSVVSTKFEPLSIGVEASASPLQNWSAQLSYFATMTEMDRRHKRSARFFSDGSPLAGTNCLRSAN
jgi:hypothetical protein